MISLISRDDEVSTHEQWIPFHGFQQFTASNEPAEDFNSQRVCIMILFQIRSPGGAMSPTCKPGNTASMARAAAKL